MLIFLSMLESDEERRLFKPDNNQSKYGTSETLTASQFKVSNKSADILARIFCGHYERPGVPKISERVANAKKWYNFL